jgi:hypothetical protein
MGIYHAYMPAVKTASSEKVTGQLLPLRLLLLPVSLPKLLLPIYNIVNNA